MSSAPNTDLRNTPTSAAPKTFGFRISRDRRIWVFTAPTGFGGRPPSEHHQVCLGVVTKVPGGWRNELACDTYPTATDAAVAAIRICYHR